MSYTDKGDVEILKGCHPKIQALFSIVLRTYNATIASGYRGEEEQNQLYEDGKSKVRYPNSKHNHDKDGTPCSLAADVYPIVNGEIPWGDPSYFYFFAGYVHAVADRLGITIEWGGDWDSDGDFSDQNFNDLGHFALVDEE